jgi:hypothetical protein
MVVRWPTEMVLLPEADSQTTLLKSVNRALATDPCVTDRAGPMVSTFLHNVSTNQRHVYITALILSFSRESMRSMLHIYLITATLPVLLIHFVGITALASAFLALSLSSSVPVYVTSAAQCAVVPEASLSVCLSLQTSTGRRVYKNPDARLSFLDRISPIQQPLVRLFVSHLLLPPRLRCSSGNAIRT